MPSSVRLCPRDIAVLEILVQRKVETLDYLHERFFSSRKRAVNRLAQLVGAGYLERTTIPGSDGAP